MKKITTLLVVLVITISAQAKIWRVNNDATKGANFITLQLCNDNASVLGGDTVHVEPSSNTYAAVNWTKALVIIGNGYFLAGTGAKTGLQQNTFACTISGDCNFISSAAGAGAPNTGAGFGVGASMAGITVTGTLRFTNVANVLVTRCNLNAIRFDNYGNTAANNIKITKNFIQSGISTTGFTGTPSVDVTFENNIFAAATNNGAFINIDLPVNMKGLFRNNIVSDAAGFGIKISNFYVTNNILINQSNFTNANVNNVYKNNIFTLTVPGNGIVGGTNGNVVNVPIANIFAANLGASSGDARFQILAAATNPAFDGGETIGAVITPDCGAFGATDRYRLSGIPAIPTVYSLIIPSGVATGASTMTISVSTKSNN